MGTVRFLMGSKVRMLEMLSDAADISYKDLFMAKEDVDRLDTKDKG